MKRLYPIFAIILISSFYQCRISDRDEDTSVNSSKSYAKGQSDLYEIFKLVHQASFSVKGIATNNLEDTTSLFGCDTLIIDTLSNPMSISIQFNGTCFNKVGSIDITYTDKYDVIGSIMNISLNNYIQNGMAISGNISSTFNGVINGKPTYTYAPDNITLSKNGNILTWSGNQTVKVMSGTTTASVTDDIYRISGFASGITLEGNAFNATISSDLGSEGNCIWTSTGTVHVTPENKALRILDFGSGCNNQATVQIYDIEYDINIP